MLVTFVWQKEYPSDPGWWWVLRPGRAAFIVEYHDEDWFIEPEGTLFAGPIPVPVKL